MGVRQGGWGRWSGFQILNSAYFKTILLNRQDSILSVVGVDNYLEKSRYTPSWSDSELHLGNYYDVPGYAPIERLSSAISVWGYAIILYRYPKFRIKSRRSREGRVA